MIRVFYHNDLDGRASAAIAIRVPKTKLLAEKQGGFDLVELDYNDEVPVWKIRKDEPVLILDFSFKPEIMKEVMKRTLDITWIDHHKTATYDYGREVKGIRDTRDKMFAACELTWKYYYNDLKMPEAIKLIGDRDKWAWKFRESSEPFNMGIRAFPHLPQDKIWDILCVNGTIETDIFMDKVKEKGTTCKGFRDNLCQDYSRYGFECWLEHDSHHYLCFAMGIYTFGSESFGDKFEKYDICISFEFDGEKYIISLYSSTVDVGTIAKSFGGGHKDAAGFLSTTMPLSRIKWCVDIENNKVGEIEQETNDGIFWVRELESDNPYTVETDKVKRFKSLAEATEYASARKEGVQN